MRLDQLSYFVTLATERHFGRAAERLNISQPRLTMQIKALEGELAVELFDRSSRPIALSPAGQTLYDEARQILLQVERAKLATRNTALGHHRRLIIGATGTAVLEYLPRILRTFRTRLPEIQLSLRELAPQDQLAALIRDEIHIGFVRPPVVDHRLEARLVHQEPFVAALPSDHPAADCRCVSLSTLSDLPLVIWGAQLSPSFRDQIMHLCQSAGCATKIIQEAYQVTTMLALVAAGFGFSLVPRSAQRMQMEGIEFRPLVDDAPLVDLFAVWRPQNTSPELDTLIEVIGDPIDTTVDDERALED